jgi:hypothetical protein
MQYMVSVLVDHIKSLQQQNSNVTNNTTHNSNVTTTTTNNDGHSTTNNNHTVNIFVNALCSENIEYIETYEDFLTQCLKKVPDGLMDVAKHVHFHPRHQRNHNIRARSTSDVVRNRALMFVDPTRKWTMADRDKVLDRVITRNYDILDHHMGNNEQKLRQTWGNPTFRRVEGWLDKMRNRAEKTPEYEACRRDMMWMIINQSKLLAPIREI